VKIELVVDDVRSLVVDDVRSLVVDDVRSLVVGDTVPEVEVLDAATRPAGDTLSDVDG
jgi:hypothetical protein